MLHHRSGTPILVTVLIVYLLGRLLLVPIQVVALVVRSRVSEAPASCRAYTSALLTVPLSAHSCSAPCEYLGGQQKRAVTSANMTT